MEAYALNNTDFVYIPPGSFIMGDNDRVQDYNKPEHPVTITKGFLMYDHEITQKEWVEVMGTRPWILDPPHENIMIGDNYPAVYITWADAQAFIARLNTGLSAPLPYSLPTEAQWEYACRAGTATHFSFGDYNSNMADTLNANLWSRENSWLKGEPYAHGVKQKKANSFGLYDMHGNVYEWCLDGPRDYTSDSRQDPVGPTNIEEKILRGGAVNVPAFFLTSFDCSSASRYIFDKDARNYNYGFRVVIALTSQLDTDGDGRKDNADNCPATYNPGQMDTDGDGRGDACAANFGDFNGDGWPDLADAILAGQVVAGMTPSMQFSTEKDPNQDSKIGLVDLVFILQRVAELR